MSQIATTSKRKRQPRQADTYRAARRADAIKAAKQHRRAVRAAAIEGREPPARPKPWSRVSPRDATQSLGIAGKRLGVLAARKAA